MWTWKCLDMYWFRLNPLWLLCFCYPAAHTGPSFLILLWPLTCRCHFLNSLFWLRRSKWQGIQKAAKVKLRGPTCIPDCPCCLASCARTPSALTNSGHSGTGAFVASYGWETRGECQEVLPNFEPRQHTKGPPWVLYGLQCICGSTVWT